MERSNPTYRALTDEALMRLFREKREEAAFVALYQRYYPSLTKFLVWLGCEPDLARDETQNIFLKLYEKPALFDASKCFKTWLFVVAKNRFYNQVRNKNKRRTLNQHYRTEQLEYPEEPQEENEMKRIRLAINDLSPNHREVMILKYSSNFTIAEISEICGCSEGTVKSRLFYAIKKLKSILKVEQSLPHEK